MQARKGFKKMRVEYRLCWTFRFATSSNCFFFIKYSSEGTVFEDNLERNLNTNFGHSESLCTIKNLFHGILFKGTV